MTFYQMLWTFYFYSFIGWCCEVVFAAFKAGKFVNRGFLFGPVCPIYGVGVWAVVLLLTPIRGHWIQAYLVAVLVPTAIEYFAGWLFDRILHTRLWDYSRMPLNLNGYVCLLFSLVWGLACMCIGYFLHPLVMRLFQWIPQPLGWILLSVFSVAILTDLILTGVEALKIPKRLHALEELERGLQKVSDGIGGSLSGYALELRERGAAMQPAERLDDIRIAWYMKKQALLTQRDELLEKYRVLLEKPGKAYARLSEAFPHMRETEAYKRYERIRELYRQWREKRGEG